MDRTGLLIILSSPSGAGKSTLVALLLRLHDVDEGAVRVDGHDVRDVTQESLRRNIGMVTQETAMFNRSARDNILYGRPDATEEEMIAAAKAARRRTFRRIVAAGGQAKGHAGQQDGGQIVHGSLPCIRTGGTAPPMRKQAGKSGLVPALVTGSRAL